MWRSVETGETLFALFSVQRSTLHLYNVIFFYHGKFALQILLQLCGEPWELPLVFLQIVVVF